MSDRVENVSRTVAVAGLLASAAFFAWFGWAVAYQWPAGAPFFVGGALMWLVAALGVQRQRPYGPGFAAGMSALTVVAMLPAGLHASVMAFLTVQVVLLTALFVQAARRAAAASPDEVDDAQWRHSGLAFAAGLAAPWLLVVGLLPTFDVTTSVLGVLGAGVAATGLHAAFRGRTWGLFAMLGAVPLLMAIPSGYACHPSAHDIAGEMASIALGIAVLPWLVPMLRFLRR